MSVKVGNVLTRFRLVTSQIQGRSTVASTDIFSNNTAVLSKLKNEQCNLGLWGLHSLISSGHGGGGGLSLEQSRRGMKLTISRI
jgi:hypothetical protein